MTTLLETAETVADEIGLSRPTKLIGAVDDGGRRFLGAAKTAGIALMRAHDWPVLMNQHTFATVASTESYALPSDFDRLVNNTQWNRSENEINRGNISPQEWAWRKGAVTVSSVHDTVFHIRADQGARKIFLDPIPSAADTVAFAYLSNQWARSAGSVAQATWQADTDTTILDDDLFRLGMLWRVKRAFGLPYLDERDEYEVEVEKAWGRDLVPPVLNATLHGRSSVMPEPNVPDQGFGQ